MSAAADLTRMLREGANEYFRGLSRCLREAGLDIDECALADSFEDDECLEFGVLVVSDGRVFTFDYRWPEGAVEDGHLETLKDITSTWEESPHASEVRQGRRVLGLPTPTF